MLTILGEYLIEVGKARCRLRWISAILTLGLFIVLFDFIEDRHEHGEALREALIDAGILRIRPVLITVGATVLALFPLALHGGPLWEALCYAQIGGLTVATTVTLFIVPVFYSIFVLDLKIIRWEERGQVARKAEVATAPPMVGSTTAPASA